MEFTNPISKTPEKLKNNFEKESSLAKAAATELEASNIYEELAQAFDEEWAKAILLDIAKEEKLHHQELHLMMMIYNDVWSMEHMEALKEVNQFRAEHNRKPIVMNNGKMEVEK